MVRGDLELGTIPRLVAIAAERHGERCAVEDAGEAISYAELAARVRRAAKAFVAAGVEPGDRVALWAPNLAAWIVAALGAHSAGAVLVPINTRYKAAEAAYVLGKSRARVLVTVAGFLGTDYVAAVAAVRGELPALQHVVALDQPASWDAFLAAGDAIPDEQAKARALGVAPGDLCDIMFTSGTTGHPKGVMATHAQTLRAFRDWSEVTGLREGDRYLVVVPFFHSFGYKAGWLACLMMGATVLPHAVFDAEAVLARLAPDRVSVLPGPPALYQSLLAHPRLRDHDLSSLRLAVTGAASIPVELIRRMRDELGFETVITGYGLTESTGIATMCRHDDDPETIARTSGRAIPGVEVRLDEGGEVLVRGYNVMQGYFEDPEQTEAAITDDGWLRTGDVGELDDRGYLRITDRVKDMFIVGGFNAYPAEIENTLLAHPALAQVAVVGKPDARLGEVGVAFCVVRPGASVDAGALIAWSRERMANFKVPREVRFVDALPMNATGKVLKYELRERVREG